MISDQTKGLYAKYSVKRLNDHGGKHTNCPFFVLDIVHDFHARNALRAYIASCRDEFPELATDLEALLRDNSLVRGTTDDQPTV